MRIKRNKSSKKKLLLITTPIVAVLTVAAVFFYIHINAPKEVSSPTVINTDKQQADNLHSNPEGKNETPNTDRFTPPPTAGDASEKKQIQVTASSDSSSGFVNIRGRIGYPVSDGSCYAQLSGPSGQTIRKDSSILQNPASTDCKTVQIPVNELAPGKWTFKLHYTSDMYEGASNEGSFSL